jgi:hypothetical protein
MADHLVNIQANNWRAKSQQKLIYKKHRETSARFMGLKLLMVFFACKYIKIIILKNLFLILTQHNNIKKN